MSDIYRRLEDANIPFYEYGITAIDSYYDEKPRPIKFLAVQSSLIELARCFSELEYPGLPYADASLHEEARFLCVENALDDDLGGPWMNFRKNPSNGVFYDKNNIYDDLRARTIPLHFTKSERSLFDAAIFATLRESLPQATDALVLPSSSSAMFQKDLLISILSGPYPASGFELLKQCGFIAREWPELALLDDVDQSKDFHPEGNGWRHTMQPFSYRKDRDLTLSLALLLHDIGKPESRQSDGKRFNQHAELGARRAAKFLSRLGFDEKTKEDVVFLIRYHMMPAALAVLPIQKTKALVADARFPSLLELFRCDEFSSFKDPARYYEACSAYRAIQHTMKNPYRNADGSKRRAARRSSAHY
jgi:poly(A) polymerase